MRTTTRAYDGDRIDTLDYLRGFALIGIALVNVLTLLKTGYGSPGSADRYWFVFLNLTVEGRFYAIFSFLFGIGFYIFLSRAKEKGTRSNVLFVRRLLVLMAMGIVHQPFHPGEALLPYAVFGFLLMPFQKLRPAVNVTIALVLLVPAAYYGGKLLLILPLFLLGLAVGQYGVFVQIRQHLRGIRKIQYASGALSVIGVVLQILWMPDQPGAVVADEGTPASLMSGIIIYSFIQTMTGLVMAAFYVTTLIRVLQSERARGWLRPMQAYGRMALTNYLGQTVLLLVAGSLFGWSGNLGVVQTTLVCIGMYAVQMTFSMLWLSVFRMGPLEWCWRILTYGKLPEMRKAKGM